MGFDPSPTNLAVLVRLCFCQFQYEKRGRTGTPFFITDRQLAKLANVSPQSVWRAKIFWKENHLIRYWVGEGNRTYYVVQFDLPKNPRNTIPATALQSKPEKRSSKSMSLNDILQPHMNHPE